MKVSDGNVNLESSKKIVTEKIVARSSAGLLLQDDGGNYIKINDGGTVDISKQSSASVYLGTAQSIITNTGKKINLDTELFDLQGEFDTSNYRFTATKAGYYLVIGQAALDNLVDTNYASNRIYKNGSSVCVMILRQGANGDPQYMISDIVQLDANDYVEIFTAHNYGANRDCKAGIYSFLTIHKLS
jgi:hypothetical protein